MVQHGGHPLSSSSRLKAPYSSSSILLAPYSISLIKKIRKKKSIKLKKKKKLNTFNINKTKNSIKNLVLCAYHDSPTPKKYQSTPRPQLTVVGPYKY